MYARSHHVRLFIVYSFDMGCSPFCVCCEHEASPVVTRFWATGCTFCLHNFGAIGRPHPEPTAGTHAVKYQSVPRRLKTHFTISASMMENTDYFHNSLSATQLRLIPSTIRHLYNIAETPKQKQLYYYYRELLRPLFYV